MKKIDENAKVTLTIRQLKQLVKENLWDSVNGEMTPEESSSVDELWNQITALSYKTKESLAVFEQIVELTEKAMEIEGDDPHGYQASNTYASLRAQKKAIESMKAAFGDVMAY